MRRFALPVALVAALFLAPTVALADEPRALSTFPDPVGQDVLPGWTWDNGGWRWRMANGQFAIGWRLADDAWYYLGPDGFARTGWQHADGAWYFLDASGAMQTGWLEDAGLWYYLGPDGAMRTGWFWDGAGWYYADASGAMRRWWLLLDGTWYYLGPDGAMRTGWNFIASAWYFFDGSGRLRIGWFDGGDGWYHTNAAGEMQAGWRYVDGMWYYLGEDGRMRTGTIELDGVPFYLSVAGNLVNASTRVVGMPGTNARHLAELNGVGAERLEVSGTDAGGILQFLDLSQGNPEGVTAEQVDDFIARNCTWMEQYYGCTSSLRGQGRAFVDAATRYGVNVVYLVAHASIESAWGCSKLSRGEWWDDPADDLPGANLYNYFGYGAYDTDPIAGGFRFALSAGWTSATAGVWGGAESISGSWTHATSRTPQVTLYEMRWDPAYTSQTGAKSFHEYATNPEFATSIGSQMASFYRQEHVEPVLNLVIPGYDA